MRLVNMKKILSIAISACFGLIVNNAQAVPFVQCPGDTLLADGVTSGNDAVPDPFDPTSNVKCMHLSGGDGYVTMADGEELYMFGFADLTGKDAANAMTDGTLAAMLPGPKIVLEEGDDFYLSLTNVGMVMRPDLADPHTVHFHGFPNASAIFDGVPDNSISINMGSTLTYFYRIVEPGTYFYHCHVEAAEHMQMGMNANLYVKPAQNKLADGDPLNYGGATFTHTAGNEYAYNDGDGTTFYDKDYALQLTSFDKAFHDASEAVQPLPFAEMFDDYPMINGRGYPDTAAPNVATIPVNNGGIDTQIEDSMITATAGERILLRISNVSITSFFSLRALGLDMQVVGMGARQMRGPEIGGPGTAKNNYYTTNTVTLGGGEAMDIIIDTTGVTPGTYYLYTTNLNYLSNGNEDFGGMMTEIVIN